MLIPHSKTDTSSSVGEAWHWETRAVGPWVSVLPSCGVDKHLCASGTVLPASERMWGGYEIMNGNPWACGCWGVWFLPSPWSFPPGAEITEGSGTIGTDIYKQVYQTPLPALQYFENWYRERWWERGEVAWFLFNVITKRSSEWLYLSVLPLSFY